MQHSGGGLKEAGFHQVAECLQSLEDGYQFDHQR